MALAEFTSDAQDFAYLKAKLTPETNATIVAWIRQGYRRALRRYEGIDLYTLGTSFFELVGKRVDALLGCDQLAYGDKVRVSLNPQQHGVSLKVNGRCAYDCGYL